MNCLADIGCFARELGFAQWWAWASILVGWLLATAVAAAVTGDPVDHLSGRREERAKAPASALARRGPDADGRLAPAEEKNIVPGQPGFRPAIRAGLAQSRHQPFSARRPDPERRTAPRPAALRYFTAVRGPESSGLKRSKYGL